MKHLLLLLIAPACLCAADPVELKLWPDGAPGQMLPHSKATEDFISTKAGKSTITDIHDPSITVYRPEQPNGTSVIVAPGGGYVFLSAVHEGTQVCEWLNSIGVTGILLKYRTPTRDEAAPHEKPVADAARAIAHVREHAKEWNLDPKRVGLLGFSAGGSLLAHLACDRATKTELPDFGIMIYGGGFVDFKDPTKLKEGFTVPKDAPPMFLACAHDDGQNPIAATVLYLEYKKLGIPCELHLFAKGGHGFGMRDNKQPINAWPKRCAEWMEAMRFSLSEQQFDREIEQAERKLESKMVQMNLLVSEMKEKELNEIAVQIQDARRLGQMAAVARLQKRKAELTGNVQQQMKDDAPMRLEINEELSRLKKEKLVLEARRQMFLDRQSAPKQP
ncbi:alpha/beta hydrolase fold domain-containing protein [Prosthecobacter sp.]|uniref:alpha/beta hydrolase fold domain-containing protein n=1 Tax=Prosthecobacter sp. TaxID=1965333 RepID=UPI002489E1E8|nr:alpha/beta hydrolase fold domain-containing protein [Prosthecobacter sp.]MDI1314321.1 alpha/beta hydrolase fold domain-containing protein [Prosthecobacter sp.]